MGRYDAFVDAFLQGDSLFRFVYVPARGELFLEEELEEADNGKFLYVPFKDSRELYLRMADFSAAQSVDVEAVLYGALSSPSPIDKFEQAVVELGLADAWIADKRAFALEHVLAWLQENGLD